MPAHDECRDDGLIPTRRRAEEIDDRGLLLHRIPKPAIIGRVRVGPHEGIVDNFVARVDLAMSVALIVIPDPSAPSREHGLDAQYVCHLPRLENPALRIHEGDALAAKLERFILEPVGFVSADLDQDINRTLAFRRIQRRRSFAIAVVALGPPLIPGAAVFALIRLL